MDSTRHRHSTLSLEGTTTHPPTEYLVFLVALTTPPLAQRNTGESYDLRCSFSPSVPRDPLFPFSCALFLPRPQCVLAPPRE